VLEAVLADKKFLYHAFASGRALERSVLWQSCGERRLFSRKVGISWWFGDQNVELRQLGFHDANGYGYGGWAKSFLGPLGPLRAGRGVRSYQRAELSEVLVEWSAGGLLVPYLRFDGEYRLPHGVSNEMRFTFACVVVPLRGQIRLQHHTHFRDTQARTHWPFDHYSLSPQNQSMSLEILWPQSISSSS
jgi:hypothetical protein